ncbi:hypothetical protein DFH08DRAFT_1081116 [Mycena albidolilacea]|uniref:Uncharacterized protein n=1 Tax=Mycena albidolilacea TaxID=1033008 RepID=A0AAD7ER35_9AGAR|nr:hypothetical protein DFH08DRAFT_1081116 [Mycena albidolilacea]
MNCQFSFGPNRSYFCSAGTVYAWSRNLLPPALVRLQDSLHPQALDTPYDVAFPMEFGTYALCWKTKRGEDCYEGGCLGPSYGRLARFIKNVATSGAHTTRTVFGPNASFFSMSPSGFCWQNLPPALEDDMHACMKIRRPTTVALGVQGAYVVLYNDGTIVFDLRGQYQMVEAIIRNTQEAARRRGVMYIALNPFVAGEFYVVYGDGSASWNIPTAWSADVTNVSRAIKAMPVPAPALPPAQVSMAEAVAPGGTGPANSSSAQGAAVPQVTHAPLASMPTGGSFSSVPSGSAPTSPAPGQMSPLASMPTGESFSSVSSVPSAGQASPTPAPTSIGSTATGESFSGQTHAVSHAVPPAQAPSPSTVTGESFSGESSLPSAAPPSPAAAASTATEGSSSSFHPATQASSTSAATSGGVSGSTYTAPAPAPAASTTIGGSVSSVASINGGSSVGSAVGHTLGVVTEELTPSDSPLSPTYAPLPQPQSTYAAAPSPTFAPAPAPAAAGQTQSQFAPQRPQVQAQAQALQRPPVGVAAAAKPAPSKIGWKQGMSMGFKAAKGFNKIVGVLGGPSLSPAQLAQQAQQQALQQVQQQNPQFTQILQTVQTVAQNVNYAQNSSVNGNSNSTPTTSFDLSNIQASLPDFSNIQTISPDFGTTVQEVVVSETVYNAGTGDTTTVVVDSTTTS